MSFALGVFDVFTYAATGSTYLACLIYVFDRLSWLPLGQLQDVSTTVLVLALILLSYLIGHMTYRLGYVINRIVPGPQHRYGPPRERFAERLSSDRARGLANLDTFLLMGAVEVHAKEAAQEVNRLRAAGLALRNVGPALALGALVALVEVFTSGRPWFAGTCAALLTASAWGATLRARDLGNWAVAKTLELAYWIPEIDPELHLHDGPASRREKAQP